MALSSSEKEKIDSKLKEFGITCDDIVSFACYVQVNSTDVIPFIKEGVEQAIWFMAVNAKIIE